jgi:hypothetical protein
MIRKIIFLASLLFSVAQANAQAISAVGTQSYGGACPEGSYQVIWSPDMTTFTILFSKMNVSIPGVAPQETQRAKCAISINLVVGGQVTVDRIDYRGFYQLDAGAYAMMSSQYFFENGAAAYIRGKSVSYMPSAMFAGGIRKSFAGPGLDNFTWTSSSAGSYTNLSPCGGPTTLDIITRLNVSSENIASAQANLDSADGTMAVTYKLNVVAGKCKYRFKSYPENQNQFRNLLTAED